MPSWSNLTSWLSDHYWERGAGRPLWESVCEMVDEAAEQLRAAMRSRLPALAPEDALGEIAYSYNLDPPLRLRIDPLRRYLSDPWALWRKAGTRERILEEFGNLGLFAEIVTWRDLADGGEPQAFGGDQSCWFLRVLRPNPWRGAILWDGGPAWDQAGVTWDASNHDPQLAAAMLRVIAKWKPAASSCRYIEIVLRVDIFNVPTEVARLPVYEDWELDANGDAKDYYNTGYL